MCITLTGKLKCQQYQTLLYCKLGTFMVVGTSEGSISSLDCGIYDGFFEILKIVPVTHPKDTGVTVHLGVKLGQVAITTPIEGTNAPVQTTFNLSNESVSDETPEPDEDDEDEDEDEDDDFDFEDESESESDAALFGELWPLEETVCLDSTLDRETLRNQSQRLRELGYSFDKDEQVFIKSV